MVYSTVAALNLSTLTQNNQGRITKKVDVPNNTTIDFLSISAVAMTKNPSKTSNLRQHDQLVC